MHAEYCEIIEKLEKQLAEAKEDVRRLTGKTVDKLDDAQLEPLREELKTALDSVENWRTARRQWEIECPDFCCPVTLKLMHEPVVTDDSRSFERKAIEA